MKKSIYLFALLLASSVSFAQVITPFTVRKTLTQKGGIVYLKDGDEIERNLLPSDFFENCIEK